jgi:hypothetical protein
MPKERSPLACTQADTRARIFRPLRSPGIDFKEYIYSASQVSLQARCEK